MATDAQTLLAGSNCYNNFSAQFSLLKLGLLRQIVLAQNPMADTSPQTLLANVNCYNCYGPGVWPLLELALLQAIANNGGGGGGSGTGTLTGNGSPVGVVTPTVTGQIYTDQSTPGLWESNGLTNTSWIQLILLMLLCLLMPISSFGAGATVSTVNGVATNLTVVGGMGPHSDANHSTNSDHALNSDFAGIAVSALNATTADSATTAGLATAALNANHATTADTAAGLTITGSSTIRYVVGYAADGTSLVTNVFTNGVAGTSTVTNLSPIIATISNNTLFAFFSETNSGLLTGNWTNDLWDIGTNANKGQIVALGVTNAVNDLTNIFIRIPNLQISGLPSNSGLNIVTNTLYTNTGNSFGFLSGTALVTSGSGTGLVTLDYTNNGVAGRQQASATLGGTITAWHPMFALIFPNGTFKLTASGTGTGSATISSFTFVNQNQ